MNLVYGHDQAVADWVCDHAPHAQKGFREFFAVGVERDGELIAGWVYNEYRGHSIHISMASTTPLWASRRTLHAIFVYPFVELGCQRVTVYTGETMKSVQRFVERLGFVREGVMRRGFSDDDAVIYGMLREECRWILKEKP